jgi:hypothetical protein
VTRWLVATAMTVFLGACTGADRSRPAPCGADVEEPLDPRSTQHLLPSAPEPEYPSAAPTSGPHLSGGTPKGAQAGPLPRPLQVTILEEGKILVQYREASPDDRRRLAELPSDSVVVAPNPAIPAAVVATAWRHRLECRAVDVTALEAFVARHRGRGPPG